MLSVSEHPHRVILSRFLPFPPFFPYLSGFNYGIVAQISNTKLECYSFDDEVGKH